MKEEKKYKKIRKEICNASGMSLQLNVMNSQSKLYRGVFRTLPNIYDGTFL